MQKVFPRTLTWNSDKAAEYLQMKPFPGRRLSAQFCFCYLSHYQNKPNLRKTIGHDSCHLILI